MSTTTTEPRVETSEFKFTPFRQQADFLRSRLPVKVVVAGTGGGKTLTNAVDCWNKAILQDGMSQDQIDRGEPYLIGFGAVYLHIVRDVMLPMLMRMVPDERLIVEPWHKTELRFASLGVRKDKQGRPVRTLWKAFHGDVTSLLGRRPNGIWADEFATFKEEVFNEILHRVQYYRGWINLGGTPRGPTWAKTRLYDPWIEGKASETYFGHWTTLSNPYYPKDRVEHMRNTLPKREFNRNFLATWDGFSGMVYEEFARGTHVKPAKWFTFLLPDGNRVGEGKIRVPIQHVTCGIDWGFGQNHPCAVVVAGLSFGRWWVLEESVAEGVMVYGPRPDCWVNRVRELRAKWGFQEVFADPARPEHIAMFRDQGIECARAENDLDGGVQAVARALHVRSAPGGISAPGMVILDTCPTLIGELQFYAFDEKTGKPVKQRDHAADGLRYLVRSHEKRGSWRAEPSYDCV